MSQCCKGNQRFTTHSGVAQTYAQMLRQAGFITRLEVPHTYNLVDNSEKRADLIVENYIHGRACFDVSIAHPWATTSLNAVGDNPTAGKAASLRESQKRDMYGDISAAAGMSFFPLVHEAYGRVGNAARNLIHVCAERIAANSHAPKAGILHYWRSRLSLCLQILLAQAIRERFALVLQPGCSGGLDESRRVDFFAISRAE
jgi:hypothetical protein